MMQTKKTKEERKREELTPRYLPNTTFGHTKLDVFNINRDFAFVHKKHHLHFARVFHAFIAIWWDFHHARSEEWKGHNLRIAE